MRILNLPFFALLGFVAVVPLAHAAPTVVVDKQPVGASATPVTITPHRAIYDMSLSAIKNGSNVSGVSGKMIFEWADACDGWAIQQNLQLHFEYAQGESSNVASNEATWESKDGKHYNFNIRRLQDGKETQNYRGKANIDAKDPKAIYTSPDGKVVKLTDATVFPSMHTRMIIEKANSGDHFFTKRVFDGTDEGGSDDVSVFVGAPQNSPILKPMDVTASTNPLDANPLLTSATAWPVHMAFFKPDDDTGAPDYEMDLTLLANGVARMMKIDYGDFSVTGTLQAIEPLPAPHC